MKLGKKVELLHRSSQRMLEALKLPRDEHFWWFMRQELWIHLKRTVEAWWYVLWKKTDED